LYFRTVLAQSKQTTTTNEQDCQDNNELTIQCRL